MAVVFGGIIAISLVIIWLKGHWFWWIVAFFPIFIAVQMATNSPTQSTSAFWGHVLGCIFIAGIPYLVWGRQRRVQSGFRRSLPYAVSPSPSAYDGPRRRRIRMWPFSYSLNDEIGMGLLHWLADQFYYNWKALWLIRRAKRIDRFVERVGAVQSAIEATDRSEGRR